MYTQIFQEIISIMHHDYAGYTDKRGWDQPNVYKTKISSMEKQGILTANVFYGDRTRIFIRFSRSAFIF